MTEEQLGRARLEHILRADDAPEIDGMTLAEVLDLALAQLEKGYNDSALQLAERAVRVTPRNAMVRALHAFCLLPSSPATSRNNWCEMVTESGQGAWTGVDPDILIADIATSYLMSGDVASAQRVLERLRRPEDLYEISAWLWDPWTLPEQPSIIHCTLEEWLDRFAAATNSGVPLPP